MPQTQACVGKKDSKQLFLGRCGLAGGVSAGLAGQQMCDYMGHSTSSVVGPSIPVQQAVPIHPEPLQPLLHRCPGLARAGPGRVALLQQPRKSSPDLQCPTSQLKRFVSEKFKPLRLFQISLCEGIICFKEVIAVIFDFHQKDILKPGKEI